MYRLLYLFIATVIAILLTSSCSTLPEASSRYSDINTRAKSDDEGGGHYPVRSIPTQTLYSLLAAEFSGVRGQFDLSLEYYLHEAHQTRDINVVARAAHIAHYAEDVDALLAMSTLWIELDPEDTEAHELAFFAYLVKNQTDEAFIQANFLLEHGRGNAIRKLPGSVRLPEEKREGLLTGYAELAAAYPNNADILFGYTMLLWQSSDLPGALKQSRKVASLEPENEIAQLLEARLLVLNDRPDEAFSVLESALKRNPTSEDINQQYLQTLFSNQDLQLAKTRLEVLSERYPENEHLKLGLALVYQETGDTESAIPLLEVLAEGSSRPDEALLQLAIVTEEVGKHDKALKYYREVRGQNMLTATMRISQLMTKNGDLEGARHYLQQLRAKDLDLAINLYLIEGELLMREHLYEEAHAILSEALDSHPNDLDLLYSRSLASEKLVDIDAVESDLRQILDQDSENSAALNALGYSLANHTTRLQEAQELIEKALSHQPNDPATIDSLGWVLYRQGLHTEALTHLRRAADTMPDPEIAAHLGEVLWVSGEREEARSIFAEALEKSPSHPVLLETIQRLEVRID